MIEEEIKKLEERLRRAMLNSDIDELDALISPELLFTNHLGHLVSKDEDLAAHRTKVFEFKLIELSESRLLIAEKLAVVSVKAEIEGLYEGNEANGSFRFTRVWSDSSGSWQVVAGHSCLIAQE